MYFVYLYFNCFTILVPGENSCHLEAGWPFCLQGKHSVASKAESMRITQDDLNAACCQAASPALQCRQCQMWAASPARLDVVCGLSVAGDTDEP